MRRVVVAALLLVLAAAATAPAKGRVQARIENRVQCDASPGSTITVAWHLFFVDRNRREPFGAGGVFVELRGAAGATPSRKHAAGRRGHFRARVRVPDGGIRRLRIGLEGWRYVGDEVFDADVFFPVVNPPCAR